MRKILSLLLAVMLLSLWVMPVMATSEAPVITQHPYSPNYPQHSVAIYTVKATGTNLTATWYIEYEGKTYNTSKLGGAMQPWEAYAGESYGAKKIDDNTFCFVFEGIEKELNGAQIWCQIEDGHYDVVSRVGYITVGSNATPPEIVDIPASITVKQGEEAQIRCVALSNSEAQLEFLWYETPSGLLPDITAVNRGAETSDFLFCDTTQIGTRYYICGITSTAGGSVYSSAVEVNVIGADEEKPDNQPQTTPDEEKPTDQPQTSPDKEEPTEQTPAEVPSTGADPVPADTSIPWWAFLAAGVVAAILGIGTAVILTKKK